MAKKLSNVDALPIIKADPEGIDNMKEVFLDASESIEEATDALSSLQSAMEVYGKKKETYEFIACRVRDMADDLLANL